VNKTPADYGINDRPCVIGENPAKGVFDDGATPTLVVPPTEMFLATYNHGWKGLMPWTSNGADVNGNLNDFGSGLSAFQKAHPELVDPSYTTGMAPAIKQNKSHSIIEGIFPNPVGSGIFKIVLLNYKDVTLNLTDEMGRLIFSKVAANEESTFSTKGLPKGIYILSAVKTSQMDSRKLVLN
jgi:hypothetical protein